MRKYRALSRLLLVFLCLTVMVFRPHITKGKMESFSKLKLDSGEIVVSYTSKDGVLKITQKREDKTHRMKLQSDERMGILIRIDGSEFIYSLKFLEEAEKWLPEGLFAEKSYKSKSITKLPSWVVVTLTGSTTAEGKNGSKK